MNTDKNTTAETRQVKKRAVGYARVSSIGQVDNWSLPGQRNSIQDYCYRNGYELARIYVDEGHSAWKDKAAIRPAYLEMMKDAAAGKFDVVVTVTIDRMSRSVKNLLETVEKLGEHNVKYVSIKEDLDFTGPTGGLMLSVLGSLAEFSSSITADHVRRAMLERAQSGLASARPPFGYALCDDGCEGADGVHGSFHKVPGKADAVLEAYERYDSGSLNFQDLADWLNAEGFRTNGLSSERTSRKRGVNRFTRHAVRRMLTNKTYTGKITFGEHAFEGIHEAIVGDDLFKRVQVLIDRNRQPHNSLKGRKSKVGHLLARVARCHECGRNLHANTKKADGNPTYYTMHKYAMGRECTFAGKSFKGEPIDDVIHRLFSGFKLGDRWREYVMGQFLDRTELDKMTRRRQEFERQRERVKHLYIQGFMDSDEMTEKLSGIEEGIKATQILPETAVDDAANSLLDFKGVWKGTNRRKQNKAVITALDAVYVDCEMREVVAIVPKAPFDKLFKAMAERLDLNLVDVSELPSIGRQLVHSGSLVMTGWT